MEDKGSEAQQRVLLCVKKLRYPIIVLVIAIDQLVKYIVRGHMNVGDSLDVLGKLFSLTYVQNRGAAFSIMNGEGVILVVLTSIAMAALIWVMEVYKNDAPRLVLSIAMLVGGGVGNLIDRVVLGFVTDMFDFHFWPVFNVADIFVVCGCLMMCWHVIRSDDSKLRLTGRNG